MTTSSHEELQDAETSGVRLPRKLRRQQLLLSALRVFSSQGYHVTTMNHIASAAEITKPVLYQHFKSKQDLYLAVLDDQIAELSRQLVTPLQEIEVNQDKVDGMMKAFFNFAGTNPQGYRLIFESDVQNDVVVAERIEALTSTVAEKMAEVLGPNTGLSQDDAVVLSTALSGMVISAAQQVIHSGGSTEELEKAQSLIFRLAWGGLYNIGEDWSQGYPGAVRSE